MAGKRGLLERISGKATTWTGSSPAFGLAGLIIVVWALTGPVFGFSDTWQLVINTGTTIVTFLMVFLIQRQQNKDSLAIHLKLNELVAAMQGASNRLINVEDLTEDDVRTLHTHYCKLVELAKKDENLGESHSVEDAEADHARKQAGRQIKPLTEPEEPVSKEPEPAAIVGTDKGGTKPGGFDVTFSLKRKRRA